MQRSRTLSLISIYSLVALSSMLLAFAEGAVFPQCLTPVVVMIAFACVERKKWFSLSTLWANLLGIAAILLAVQELFSGNIEGRLLSGAHLLVYLTWIVLLQKKETRHYWWLITLSLLQVSVGSVLTYDGSYGLLLLLFLVASIWTLSLFWVQQLQDQFSRSSDIPETEQTSFVVAQNQMSSAAPVLPQESFTRSGICFLPGETWLTRRFVFGLFSNILGAAFISAFFFILIPRIWIGSGRIAEAADKLFSDKDMLTGFSEEVKLGEIGSILESTKKVLEVKMYLRDTDQVIDVEEYSSRLGYNEPYFRGSVLEEYRKGKWKLSKRISPYSYSGKFSVNPPENTIRQEYILHPIGTEKLFAIHPFMAGWSNDASGTNDEIEIVYDSVRHFLQLEKSKLSKSARKKTARKVFRYTVYSPSKTKEKHLKYLPVINENPLHWRVRLLYTAMPIKGVSKLKQLAKDVVARGEPTTDQLIIAKRLESFLRNSGEYRYTLDQTRQDRSIDPVEDFLFNRKEGHCEYYASALTLMLRAVNIPARLVSGFKGGSKNQFTGLFEIQERHAHAWVEAYIDGRWILLDATPAAREEAVGSISSQFSSWEDFKSMVKLYWNEYVVQMSFVKQRDSLYNPLKTKISSWWNTLSSGKEGRKVTMAAIKKFVTSPQEWFSFNGGIASFVLMIFLTGCYLLFRKIIPWLFNQFSIFKQNQQQKNKATMRVIFYERFCKLCASKGLIRKKTETHQEFAHQAIQHLNADLIAIDSLTFPQELVTLFYQIRFGNVPLEEPQRRLIDQLLSKLERQLTNG